MKLKDKWLASVSLGEQTFRTEISDKLRIAITLFFLTFTALLLISQWNFGSQIESFKGIKCQMWGFLFFY